MVFASILTATNTMEIEERVTGIINPGFLNRFLFEYDSNDFEDKIPPWSDVDSTKNNNYPNNYGPVAISNGNIQQGDTNDLGNHYTYFYQGFIFTLTDKNLFVAIASDDDSIALIMDGQHTWSSVVPGPNSKSYTDTDIEKYIIAQLIN